MKIYLRRYDGDADASSETIRTGTAFRLKVISFNGDEGTITLIEDDNGILTVRIEGGIDLE